SDTVEPNWATCVGVELEPPAPLASCPCPLSPQHHKVWSGRVAHVKAPMAETVATTPSPDTAAATGSAVPVVVLPNSPTVLEPQQSTMPSVRSAQACEKPVATAGATGSASASWPHASDSAPSKHLHKVLDFTLRPSPLVALDGPCSPELTDPASC